MSRKVVRVIDILVIIAALSEQLERGVTLANETQSQFILFSQQDLDRHIERSADSRGLLEPYAAGYAPYRGTCLPFHYQPNRVPTSMQDDKPVWLDNAARRFDKASWPIIAISAVLTGVLLFQLVPELPTFHTDLSEFAPDNEASEATDRMEKLFPAESRPVFIHVERDDGGNVLDIATLQIMHTHLLEIRNFSHSNQDLIATEIAAPSIVETALQEEGDGTNISELQSWTQLLDLVVDEDVNCLSERDDQVDSLASFARDSLLHKDLQYSKVCDYLDGGDGDATPIASSTLWVLEIDPSLDVKPRQVKQNLIRQQFAELSEESELTYSLASLDLIAHDIDDGTFDNLVLLVILSTLVVVVILAIAFRSIRGVAFPLVGLSCALIWTYGTLAALGTRFSALEVAVAPLVLGLGIDYSIHLQRRYEAFREEGLDAAQSWLLSCQKLSVALSLAVLTTVAAFLSNIFSDLPPVRMFGLALALGVVSAFLASTVVVGSMHVLMDKAVSNRAIRSPLRFPRIVDGVLGIQKKHQAVVLITAVVISFASVFGAANLETEFDLGDFLDDEMPVMQVRQELQDSYTASAWKLVYLFWEPAEGDDSIVADSTLLNQLDVLDNRLGHIHGVVGVERSSEHPAYEGIYTVLRDKVQSDESFGERHNLAMYGNNLVRDNSSLEVDLSAALVELADDDEISDPLTGRSWSDRVSLVVAMEDGEISALRMEVRVVAATSAESSVIVNEIEQQLGTESRSGTIRYAMAESAVITVTGDLVMLDAVLDGLNDSQVESTAISLAVSFAVLVILTRRLMPAMVALTPVALATLWVVGSMVIFGLNWNVLTVMVTALTIGIGIDYSIHVWRRFEVESAQGDNPWQAMKRTLSTTGVALGLSAGTTICGFMVLLASPMPVIRDFGLVTSLTVMFSLVLTVIVMPVLLVMSSQKEGLFSSED
tara:strand:+ start:1123 stop:3948 length:2826 start_codon:yes stop_codon:yes gene_type:complete